jgi:flagellar biosynthesis protein FlhG
MTITPTAVPHLTAIGSGKGGTGKTLIAVSLAQALSREGERVLLCDADLGLSNAAVRLGLSACGDLPALMCGTRPLEDCVVPVQGGAATEGGFDLVAAPSGSGALANAGALAAENLMARLRGAKKYDRVLIDLAAGVDAAVMRFASAADEALLVLTPDPASLTDAYAFAKLLLKLTGTRMPRVIVNMSESEAEARRTQEAMMATCKAFLKCAPALLGHVPRDAQAQDAVRRQLPLLARLPHGPAARALIEIARGLHDAGDPALQKSRLASKR